MPNVCLQADVTLEDNALAAQFFEADGIILTGKHTGDPVDAEDILRVKTLVTDIPVIVGSGVDASNLQDYRSADAVIIGSSLKQNNHWKNSVSTASIEKIIQAARKLKLKH